MKCMIVLQGRTDRRMLVIVSRGGGLFVIYICIYYIYLLYMSKNTVSLGNSCAYVSSLKCSWCSGHYLADQQSKISAPDSAAVKWIMTERLCVCVYTSVSVCVVCVFEFHWADITWFQTHQIGMAGNTCRERWTLSLVGNLLLSMSRSDWLQFHTLLCCGWCGSG